MYENTSPEPLSRKEAMDNLEKAIGDYIAALGYGDSILLDWVLYTASHRMMESGEEGTSHVQAVRRGQPTYRTRGLLETALDHIRRTQSKGTTS